MKKRSKEKEKDLVIRYFIECSVNIHKLTPLGNHGISSPISNILPTSIVDILITLKSVATILALTRLYQIVKCKE